MSTLFGTEKESSNSKTPRIIKAVDVPMVTEAADTLKRAKLLASDMERQARENAERIISEAKHEASHIIENTKNDCRELVQRITQEEQQKAEQSASEYLLNMTSDLQNQMENLNGDLIELVGRALEKIIGEIDETDRIEKAVSQGLRELKDRYGLILLVHSSDYDAAQVAVSRFHSFVGHEKGPIHRVEVDADLKPGECMILSSGGLLDISLKSQIRNITEGLHMRHQGAG